MHNNEVFIKGPPNDPFFENHFFHNENPIKFSLKCLKRTWKVISIVNVVKPYHKTFFFEKLGHSRYRQVVPQVGRIRFHKF